ncbi:MAG: NAD-dependent epimerase/dehydratase family protein [Solirubrobacteraceae bacterium]
MSRVLVTGATGFIGRGTLEPLLGSGLEVHAISSRPAPSEAPAGVRWHELDLLAPGGADAVAELEATHLLHLAWTTEPGRFWTSPQNLDWLAASLHLARAFAAGGGRRMVMAGTCAEYAWAPDTHCVERETPTEPATLYGTAKHALHTTVAAFAAQEEISLAWGRIFFVFGPHEQRGRLASSVAESLLRGETAECSAGTQVRDFLYAPELAEAFAALTVSGVEGPVNMASGAPVPLRDLISALAHAAGRPELVALGARPTSPTDPARLTADVARLRDEVGWTPALTLQEAAERTVAWWRRQLA